MISWMLTASLTLFGISIAIIFIRILLGPTFADRVMAMDVVGVNLISAIAIISIIYQTKAFLEVILVIGILAFIGTIAYAKFIERGAIIERKRDL